jgi:hypothetical protein
MKKGIAGVPLKDVAAPLRELWLRFHQSSLCLGVDALFVFQPRGMEVWCRIKDERSYQQLSAWAAPLRKNFQIELYPTHADREKKPYSPEDDDPPPSFWTNGELRSYLHDANISRLGAMLDDVSGQAMPLNTDPELKRRLKLFADDLLSLAGKMERLASDLPALAEVAFGEELSPEVRARARGICLDHVREVSRCALRLAENMRHALPRASEKAAEAKPAAKEPAAAAHPLEGALGFSAEALEMAHRVVRFVYPQAHTVDLSDLKKPSLIEALKALQQSAAAYISNAQKHAVPVAAGRGLHV